MLQMDYIGITNSDDWLLRGNHVGRGLQEGSEISDNGPPEQSYALDGFQICFYIGFIAFCMILAVTFCGPSLVRQPPHHERNRGVNGKKQKNMDAEERRKYILKTLVVKHVVRMPPTSRSGNTSSLDKMTCTSKIVKEPEDKSSDQTLNPTSSHETEFQDIELQRHQQIMEFRRSKSDLILSDSSDDADDTTIDCTDESTGEHQPQCAICLCAYQEGEEICWSRNCECEHVFHHQCIKEWLLKHDDCPCCRNIFLIRNDGSDNRI